MQAESFVAGDSLHCLENDEFLCDADSLADVFGISSFCADDSPTLTVQHINATSVSSTTATHGVDLIKGASHEDADTFINQHQARPDSDSLSAATILITSRSLHAHNEPFPYKRKRLLSTPHAV